MTLVIEDLRITGPDGPLFAPLSLRVGAGQTVTVTGPSGIGKSTLLDAIGGHLARAFTLSGRVLLDGRDITRLPPEARGIGVVFQDAALFPHLSLGGNLAFALGPQIRGRVRRRGVIEDALRQAGLAGMAARDPATLSGGQRTRAALLRSLLAEPAALLLDEPFAALDPGLRAATRRFVFDHLRRTGTPALLVTHLEEDAEAAGGPVIRL